MDQQSDAIVVAGGARTAIGTYGGAFKDTPAYILGAVAIKEAVSRSELTPQDIDEVIMGCVGQVGPDAFNARRAALEAGLPVSTPAYNVNRLCASGLQALASGAAEIIAGQSTVVVAGGDENMTMQPFMDFKARSGYQLGPRALVDGTLSLVTDPWGNYPMGVTAEKVAARFGVSREEQDCFAYRSQQRATAAVSAGVFAPEIVGVVVQSGDGATSVDRDEHPRDGVTVERLGRLKPVFQEGGTVTAGNSSGINDGGAAVVLVPETLARARHLRPLGRIAGFARAAIEPEFMGYAPTFAIRRLLEKAGLRTSDLGVVELNEAFAAQAVAVMRDAELDPEIVNPNGGAIALGHPVGATGTMLSLKLLYEMRRRQAEWGMVAMCIGGGQALAGLFQLID